MFKLTCFLTPLVLLLYYRPIFGGKIQTLICLLKSIIFDRSLAFQEWYYRGSSHFMISQFMILANSWFFSGINFMNSSQIHDFETKNRKKKNFRTFFQKFFRLFFRFVSYFFIIRLKMINYRRRLEIFASKDLNLW